MTSTLLASLSLATLAPSLADPSLAAAAARARATLVARHGEGQRARVERGVSQVAAVWRAEDGDAGALQRFLEAQFTGDRDRLDALLGRFEAGLEAIDGAAVEVNRALARHAVLDLGPRLPVDDLLAAFDAGAHVTDDLFASR